MSGYRTRFLEPGDVPALLTLESIKWEPAQAADAEEMLRRIRANPTLSVGCFCPCRGKALASLFLCPISPAAFTAPTLWESTGTGDAVHDVPDQDTTRSLFGISLSSIDGRAVQNIFTFLYPHLLGAGWRDIYLGSPIPGFKRALEKNPSLKVWQYVHAKRRYRSKEPLDPQLLYYYKKGFRQIVSIHANYFPHAASHDYGVILRFLIPLSRPRPLWRVAPFGLMACLSRIIFR